MKETSALAIWSLVLGILSIGCCCAPGAIPAIICGHLARSRIRQAPDNLTGDGMALAGLIMGYVTMVIMIILCFLALMGVIIVPELIKAFNACARTG